MHPPATVRFPVDLHPGATLRTAVGVADNAAGSTGPLEFEIVLSRAGAEETVFRRVVTPADPGERHWHEVAVALPAGGRGELLFSIISPGPPSIIKHPPNTVEPGGGFAFPQVVSEGAPWTPPAFGPRSAALISIDTLRTDCIGAYGDPGLLTPHLDRHLRRAAVWPDAWSPSHWTLPAHMSAFTSTPPDVHGVTPRTPLSLGLPTLPERLHDAGIATAGFVADIGWLSGYRGFSRGFDVYLGSLEDSGSRIRRVREHLESVAGRDVFVFVHLFDAHGDAREIPYEASVTSMAVAFATEAGLPRCRPAPCIGEEMIDRSLARRRYGPEEEAAMRAAYRAGIADADASFAALVSELRGAGFLGKGLLAVMSDHGEELADHGTYLHVQLYPEVTRVLLALSGPGIAAGLRRGRPSLVDLAPTLAAHAGIPVHDAWMGSPLAGTAPERAWAATDEGHRILRGDGWSLWREPHGSLTRFDLDRDPGELAPLAADPGDARAAELERLAADHARRSRSLDPAASVPVTPEDAEHLRALGYLQ